MAGGTARSALRKFSEVASSEFPFLLLFIAASTDPMSAPATNIRSDNPIVGEREKNCPPERVEKYCAPFFSWCVQTAEPSFAVVMTLRILLAFAGSFTGSVTKSDGQ